MLECQGHNIVSYLSIVTEELLEKICSCCAAVAYHEKSFCLWHCFNFVAPLWTLI